MTEIEVMKQNCDIDGLAHALSTAVSEIRYEFGQTNEQDCEIIRALLELVAVIRESDNQEAISALCALVS
jgi:hypothetical protein